MIIMTGIIISLIVALAVLGLMFIWFPSFFFILKYTLMAIVGLSMFSVSYSLLTTFTKEYIVTAIVSLVITTGVVLAMRVMPFYITISVTIIILVLYVVLKSTGITELFRG